jgi:hypothetical protein
VATRTNAIDQAERLLVESDLRRDSVASGRILVVPMVYSLTRGELTFLDAVSWKAQKTSPPNAFRASRIDRASAGRIHNLDYGKHWCDRFPGRSADCRRMP